MTFFFQNFLQQLLCGIFTFCKLQKNPYIFMRISGNNSAAKRTCSRVRYMTRCILAHNTLYCCSKQSWRSISRTIRVICAWSLTTSRRPSSFKPDKQLEAQCSSLNFSERASWMRPHFGHSLRYFLFSSIWAPEENVQYNQSEKLQSLAQFGWECPKH